MSNETLKDANEIPPGLHLVEAHNWCQAADREAAGGNPLEAQGFAAVGQLHATLAVAEELKRLNEKLGGADFSDFLDNLRSDINEIVWRNTGGGK